MNFSINLKSFLRKTKNILNLRYLEIEDVFTAFYTLNYRSKSLILYQKFLVKRSFHDSLHII